MEKAYAQALHNAVAQGAKEDAVFESLKAQLSATGRLKLLPRILFELRSLSSRKGAMAPLVEAASESGKAEALKGAKEAGIDVQTVVVNESLISGWRAQKEGLLVDRSGKRALIDLYRRITG